ncbi:MAG: molecular chaperone DjiA [Pseudomonadota bacterium]
MSIWKRIGDALGALIDGEPLSAVFEKLRTPPERSVAFTIAVIALGAKMAKADGRVTSDEVAAFRRIFTIPPGEEKHAARIFNLARTDVSGYEIYASQVATMFAGRQDVLRDLLEGLVFIAVADGEYHPNEDVFLRRVVEIFGLPEHELRTVRARHLADGSDPYAILGVEPEISEDALRRRWRTLVRDLHPDRMIGRGVPVEAQRMAEQRLAAVNDAYAQIRQERQAAFMPEDA